VPTVWFSIEKIGKRYSIHLTTGLFMYAGGGAT
jgi:hypothetical protein